jgi:hypothetical protein
MGDGLFSAVSEPVAFIVGDANDISFNIVGRSISSRPQRKSDERIMSHTVLCEPYLDTSTSYGDKKYRSFFREKLKYSKT